jgi:hypothetical protein
MGRRESDGTFSHPRRDDMFLALHLADDNTSKLCQERMKYQVEPEQLFSKITYFRIAHAGDECCQEPILGFDRAPLGGFLRHRDCNEENRVLGFGILEGSKIRKCCGEVSGRVWE